ncbi:OLC1v1008252C1 [Oldenlandia corymbosa var. corymbosa]|uniref:OLC1v1008252C1 n=1 Tax=Oldenlandia corymbosa var. corymbosa TaxID=529605 RepID=A0AAV1DLB1_OLDCO|nr:OLC1v1008252C1 [Oldenlandia corymbosa var. corymbosa]
MATPSKIQLFLNLLLFLAFIPAAFSTAPTSSVSSIDQLQYWSKNVLNPMPKTIASKLSPLLKQDSNHFASLVSSKQRFPFDYANFCSKAKLFCSTTLDNIRQNLGNGYNSYNIDKHASNKGNPDPNSFFRLAILKNGNKIHLPDLNDRIPFRAFLPSQIASKISTMKSNDLENFFPQSFTSPVTKEAIETSILYCSSPRLKGEIKSCPNSVEDMINFSKKSLGENKLIALTSQSTKGSNKEVEIQNIKQFRSEKVVSCHEIFFPFATYFCHLLSSTRLYSVDVVDPATKVPVNRLLAICHMDTSGWPVEHVAFKILKFTPGRGEACHWFTQIDLVWLGNNGADQKIL